MQLSSARAEVGGVGEHINILFPCKQEGILWESDVVADAQAKLSIFRLERGKLGRSRTDIVAFKERDASWNIHVEKVLLAMSGRDLSLFIEAEASVEDASIVLDQLRNAASNDVRLCLFRQLR